MDRLHRLPFLYFAESLRMVMLPGNNIEIVSAFIRPRTRRRLAVGCDFIS
jgi:hypothetical protein